MAKTMFLKQVKWRLYEYAKYTLCELYNFIDYDMGNKIHYDLNI